MAQQRAAWNWVTLALCVAFFIGLQSLVEWLQPFENMHWERSTTVLAVVLFLLGGGLILVFRGGFWTQTLFAVLVPVLAQVVLQLTRGSDPAYPGLTMLLAVPYALLFFLGAVFIGGPLFLWTQPHTKSHLTSQ